MNYQGKFSNGSSAGRPGRRSRRLSTKLVLLVLALSLLSGAVLGTLAYLNSTTENVTNTFTPAKVPNIPEEKIKDNAKTSITIKNEGNIYAYIRIRLVTYRVDDNGNRIGGTATIPEFDLGSGWFKDGDFYYYESAVAPGYSTPNLLALNATIPLKTYDDADGGKQVIEVISESIQSDPTSVVTTQWGVNVDANGKLTKGGNA